MTIQDRAKELLLNKTTEKQIQEDIEEIVTDFMFMTSSGITVNTMINQVKSILEQYNHENKITRYKIDSSEKKIYISFEILNEQYTLTIKL